MNGLTTSAEQWKIFTENVTSHQLLIPEILRGMFRILYVLRCICGYKDCGMERVCGTAFVVPYYYCYCCFCYYYYYYYYYCCCCLPLILMLLQLQLLLLLLLLTTTTVTTTATTTTATTTTLFDASNSSL
jgi:hypothetical protein